MDLAHYISFRGKTLAQHIVLNFAFYFVVVMATNASASFNLQSIFVKEKLNEQTLLINTIIT
jgi:hypothetical protein